MRRTAALIVVAAALLASVAVGVRARGPSAFGALQLVGAGMVDLGGATVREPVERTVERIAGALDARLRSVAGAQTDSPGARPAERRGAGDAPAGSSAQSAPMAPSAPSAPGAPVEARVYAVPTSIASPLVDRPTFPGAPRRLLETGCCAQAWWSDDSRVLRYIDRPEDSPATALYEVPVWPPGEAPRVADTTAGHPAGAPRFTVRHAGEHSIVRNLDSGEEWPLPTGGAFVKIAPDGSRAVWWSGHAGRQGVDSLIRVFAADIYGREVRELIALWGTTVVSFLPDNRNVLIVGRPLKDDALGVLVAVDTDSGALIEIARGEWLSNAAPSPDGRWAAYMISLDREHPERNGVWVVPIEVDGRQRAQRLDVDSSYRWRAGGRLVYMPLESGGAPQTVWEFDPSSGSTRRLLGPEIGLRVAEDDWSVSPDGATLAYLDRAERSLWVVDLP